MLIFIFTAAAMSNRKTPDFSETNGRILAVSQTDKKVKNKKIKIKVMRFLEAQSEYGDLFALQTRGALSYTLRSAQRISTLGYGHRPFGR